MICVKFHALHQIPQEKLMYVVTAARFRNQWVFCRHKARQTWELPGGRIEAGETPQQAMERELREETGALKAETIPVCIYSVTTESQTTYGMLFFSRIRELGAIPADFEIGEILLAHQLPPEQTYPQIQPALFTYIQGWLNAASKPYELWDVYDENRQKTGLLHRRGEPLPDEQFHLVVHVWILDSRGNFLLTKRSPTKGFPNMWESTGGSALAGDDSLTAALREVSEETGLTLDPGSGRCLMQTRHRDYFRDVWLFRQDYSLGRIVLQPGETIDKMAAGKDQVLSLWERGELVPYDYLPQLMKMV
ncbi:MAG: NUDIX domain-containing protein [Oscillospiraceae bacterium]|nr:NUDIX domain-containing protein [Oscillospiraceae bacterium]